MSAFQYQDMLPTAADDSPFRRLSGDYVSTFEAAGQRFLRVEPEALTLLTREAMRDIAHLLRPGHLTQLANILKDPEASPNDRFVALDLLKNANISTIRELVQKSEQEMLKTKNFGRKSLNEIKEILSAMGLTLGMKFDEKGAPVFPEPHAPSPEV